MKILEILGAKPLSFKWLDENRAVFTFNDQKFGIYADLMRLELNKNIYDICNISFGTFDKTFKTSDDLSTSLTRFKNPLTIFSTVAKACLSNKEIIECDHICLIGADEDKEKRSSLYSVAAHEIITQVESFNRHNLLFAYTSKGSLIVSISKQKLTPEEQQELGEKLKIGKLTEIPKKS